MSLILDDIHIENWQTFLDNNVEIQEDLNLCCSNVADMIANITSINAMAPGINDALSTLKTVSAPSIDEGSSLLSLVNEFGDYFKDRSLKIVSGVSYAELVIDAYNNGKDVDSDATNAFEKILQGTADTNVYWVLNEALKTTAYGAIGFLLAYGTDAHNEGGNYVVGDGVNKLFNTGLDKVFHVSDPAVWVNAAVGAVVVAGYTAWQDYNNDKGEMTQKDWERLALNAGSAALSYAEWTLIAGSIGGVPGVIVAGLLAIPTAYIFGGIKDLIVGDNIIDTFERNGETFEVPRNGNGKNGTWDALVDLYDDSMEEYRIGDRRYSEHDFKDKLYNDWGTVFSQDAGIDWEDDYAYSEGTREMNEIMDKAMASCTDPDDISYAFWEEYENGDYPNVNDTLSVLNINYGFDVDEWIQYRHANA